MNKVLRRVSEHRLLLSFILTCTSIYLLLKFMVPHFATSKINQIVLEQTGFKLNTQEVAFEPFGLMMNFQGLSFNDNHYIKEISIELSLMNILKKRIVVSHLNINRIQAKILKTDNGYSIVNLEKPKVTSNNKIQEQSEWGVVIRKLNITQSNIQFIDGPLFKIENLLITDLFSFDSSENTIVSGSLSLNSSEVKLNGTLNNYLSKPSAQLTIETQRFDLQEINFFKPHFLGNIEGLLKTKTEVTFKKNAFKVSSELNITEFKLFSKDSKIIDYYSHDLKISNASAEQTEEGISISADDITFNDLILSIKNSQFEAKKMESKNTKVQLQDFIFFQPSSVNEKKSPMVLSTQYNHGGLIKIEEQYKGNKKTLDINFSNIDLLPFSKTFEAILGYQIETGKLNLDINLLTHKHKTMGQGKVVLNQFKIDDENESGKKIKKDTTFPFKTAVSIIRDDNGAVELEFDISGDERNPKFGFMPLLSTGLGSVILSKLSSIIATKAATQFLPLLVSNIPFSPGNALMLVNGGYRFLTKPKFQDIEFEAQTDIIKSSSKPTLLTVKKFLVANKKLSFVFCPLATINEFKKGVKGPSQSKNDALVLAFSRIEKIKKEILDTPKIHAQVIFCRPKIIEDKLDDGILQISL
jgi:hypothetical protein